MIFWVPELDFFDDLDPHAAPLNMAIDEALLGILERPLLRVYRWARPAVSFGYFEGWAPVRAAHPDRDPVRRWTGGGVVLHGRDFTYSLSVPPGEKAGRDAAPESYAAIHHALGGALRDCGLAATSAHSAGEKVSQACFENPVPHDVLLHGHKVAGAAQRRTRLGLLHQGSVQGVKLPEDFGAKLAARLARKVRPVKFALSESARMLAATKYGTKEWLERTP